MELLIIFVAIYLLVVSHKEKQYVTKLEQENSSLKIRYGLCTSKLQLLEYESSTENPNV